MADDFSLGAHSNWMMTTPMYHHALPAITPNSPVRTIFVHERLPAALALWIGGLLLVSGLAGCSSKAAPIEPVAINSSKASVEAIALYDKNGDSLLNAEELDSVPALKQYLKLYDKDGDGAISRQEIADRIDLWENQGVGIRSLNVLVLFDNRPLPGASLRFIPEPYLGDGPKVATGICDQNGATKVTVSMDDLPEALKAARLGGIFGGTYKIEVTHPQNDIPSRYNANTTLGEEIARDTVGSRVVLKLEKN
jgi:hypothetical protein